MPPSHDQLFAGCGSQLACRVQGKSLHQAFSVDVRIKKSGAPAFQSRNHFQRRDVCQLRAIPGWRLVRPSNQWQTPVFLAQLRVQALRQIQYLADRRE